ncbi:hypothetical protein F53441_3359 [Fusarium austroafricanum]|uniref:3CxxC-type domain-containing protein n=1 Tax=Fusarium austroafricanum TaxID=2364996 RepID=A0A8H4KR57_9HYPO|nr:hypothetical protein F53441_3359 [Fusarium austroafricanum]
MVNRETKDGEPKSSMYPELHSYVALSLEEDDPVYTFREQYQKTDIKRVFDTKVIGKFFCHRSQCGNREWHSNSIAIRIREYHGNQYNVQVYHQQCSKCKKPTRAKLDKPIYADRVAYRIKKWNGIEAEQLKLDVETNGAHRAELCERCQKGHCGKKRRGDKNDASWE